MSEAEEYDIRTDKGINLYQGMELPSSGDGYTLEIASYNDSALQGLHDELERRYEEAEEELGEELTERQKVGIATGLVGEYFEGGDVDRVERDGEVYLSDALQARQGVCKERAATLHMLLRMEDIESKYVRGTAAHPDTKEELRHAWVKVEADGEEYLADPSIGRFGKHTGISGSGEYREGENHVRLWSDEDESTVKDRLFQRNASYLSEDFEREDVSIDTDAAADTGPAADEGEDDYHEHEERTGQPEIGWPEEGLWGSFWKNFREGMKENLGYLSDRYERQAAKQRTPPRPGEEEEAEEYRKFQGREEYISHLAGELHESEGGLLSSFFGTVREDIRDHMDYFQDQYWEGVEHRSTGPDEPVDVVDETEDGPVEE